MVKLGDMYFDLSNLVMELLSKNEESLAADIILNKEVAKNLKETVGAIIQRLFVVFTKEPSLRRNIYRTLVEIVINLFGIESIKAGFSENDKATVIRKIRNFLERCESLEKKESKSASVAYSVVQEIIDEMKHVMMGNSMVAKMAEEIESKIDRNEILKSFLDAAQKVIQENIYYQMVTQGITKFGNDSATGLRWARHVGAVQVSSNPVIAARAYEEFPYLWDEFEKVVVNHPEWFDAPERFGDEIVMQGTIVSLLPNLLIFRPIFLLSNFQDGLVSYQINPFKAVSLKETIDDALKIYSHLRGKLEKIDPYFWNDDLEGMGRPNVVFKIAGCGPSAIEITETLNEMGIGTNNTVTYSVSQEVYLILAAISGMAKAVKAGIPLTQAYETNMIGRLEDHLREAVAEDLLRKGLEKVQEKDVILEKIAAQLGVLEEVKTATSLDEKIRIVCSGKSFKSSPPKTILRTLTDKNFVAILKDLYYETEDVSSLLAQLEDDIHFAGIYVTRKVYSIFFAPENRAKWIRYIMANHNLSKEEAEEVMSKIDLLPASKRRADDTYLVLGAPGLTNLTNTEFPSQQLQVWTKSRLSGFQLLDYEGSIMDKIDEERLNRLLKIPDFRKSFELTLDLVKILREVGIKVGYEQGGIRPEEWPSFGPVVKTLEEFQIAYKEFERKAVEFVKKIGEKSRM